MPFGGLLVGGMALGAASGIAGSIISANAQQNIAEAQAAAAEKNRKDALNYAMPTAAELMEQSKQIAYQDQMISRQEKLLSAVDPALIESGKQALQLLQGKQAAVLGPLQAERERQRNALTQQLQDQMGPGAAASTAGAAALNKFDTETANIMSGAQQQSLGQLLGVSQFTAQNSYGGTQGMAGFNNILGNLDSVQRRQVSAALGTDLTPYAGSEFVGANTMGAAIGKIGGNIGQAATFAGLMQAGKAPTVGGTSGVQGNWAGSDQPNVYSSGNAYDLSGTQRNIS